MITLKIIDDHNEIKYTISSYEISFNKANHEEVIMCWLKNSENIKDISNSNI